MASSSCEGGSSENNITTTDEECDDFQDVTQLRNMSTLNTKKISEMQYQFDDARVRIDKLLRRTYPTYRRDSEYSSDYKSYYPTSYDFPDRSFNRSNSINSNDSCSRNSTDSNNETKMHKTEVKVKPKKLLREVSISIKCEQDQPIRIIDVS